MDAKVDYCSHSKPVLYLPEWDMWAARMREYDTAQHMPMFCGCTPPSKFQERYMTETIQLARDARIEKERWYLMRLEREKKSPGKGVEKSDDADDSAGRWYFITFTQPDTDKEPHDLLKRTQKVIKSKMVCPIQWCYSLELTEKGTPHTHIRLFTEKYFDYKKIEAFNKGWRVDIKKEKFNSANYIIKDCLKHRGYAEEHEIELFYCSDNYGGPRPELISEP